MGKESVLFWSLLMTVRRLNPSSFIKLVLEWDLNGLRTPEGTKATEEEVKLTIKSNFCMRINKVTARAKQKYEIFPIIVRDNRASKNNEEFISTHLASRPENVQKVYSDSFEENIISAFERIVSSI